MLDFSLGWLFFHDVIHVKFIKSNHSWMQPNVVLNDGTTLGAGKSDGNSQVHCHFMVTLSLQTVQVATIISHGWNPCNFSFPQMKRGDCKPRSHVWFCDHILIICSYIWLLRQTECEESFGYLYLLIQSLIISPISRCTPIWAFCFMHFESLIHMGPQMV